MSTEAKRRPAPLTEAELSALRSQVPDGPVRIPDSQVACECCGIAVEFTSREQLTKAKAPPTQDEKGWKHHDVYVTRCPSCADVAKEAAAFLVAHPGMAGRLGSVAKDRVEQALLALQVLGRPRPSEVLFDAVWPKLWRAAGSIRFANPTKLRAGYASPHPWAHVGLADRADLRAAYAEGLRERTARAQAPVTVPCPSGCCLMCGVASVHRPAAEVVRLGGAPAASLALWRTLVTQPSALGGSGPDRVRGYLCPACSRAVDTVGAVGATARDQAVVNYVQVALTEQKARRLADRLRDDLGPSLPAWAAVKREPNTRPWEHLESLFSRL